MAKNDILSYGSIAQSRPMDKNGGRHIVAISGGVASAWVANWVKENITGEIIYYFNDTKWEHKDLYRFLSDLESTLDISITNDSDGRSPEDIFYKQKMLGNNRAPICSRVLKAERLHKYVRPGDILYFGIDQTEVRRAARITPIYARLQCECRFPLIENRIMRHETFNFIESIGIEMPQMYKDGFTHNNCSGGCVRAGKRQWISLLNKYPDVYLERERLEEVFSEKVGKKCHFMKDMSLRELREAIEKQIEFDFGEDEWQGECVGICGRMY